MRESPICTYASAFTDTFCGRLATNSIGGNESARRCSKVGSLTAGVASSHSAKGRRGVPHVESGSGFLILAVLELAAQTDHPVSELDGQAVPGYSACA